MEFEKVVLFIGGGDGTAEKEALKQGKTGIFQ